MTAPAAAQQQERSRATQRRLLDATVDCLVEFGWAGTTTTVIAERAGVSRGAQLHHYPTKAALVLAAVAHLAERRGAEIRAEAATLPAQPPQKRVARVVDLLAAAFTGPLFVAALELWVAARTDPELRDGARAVGGARRPRRCTTWPSRCSAPTSRGRGYARPFRRRWTSCAGLGVASLLTDDTQRARRAAGRVEAPTRAPADPEEESTSGARRGSRRPQRGVGRPGHAGRDLPAEQWATRRPRPVGRSRTRSPTWPGPIRRALLADQRPERVQRHISPL